MLKYYKIIHFYSKHPCFFKYQRYYLHFYSKDHCFLSTKQIRHVYSKTSHAIFFRCAFCKHDFVVNEEHVEEVYNGPAQEALKKLEDVEQDLQGG